MVRFSTPDPQTSIIRVTRVLPDGKQESIGYLYPDFNQEEDSVQYLAIDSSGEELLPPSSDFTEIEKSYQKSLKEIAESLKEREIGEVLEEYEERKDTLKGIRNSKIKEMTKYINR